jgi:DNA-binding MarR family transcriptional regulator
VSRTNRPAGDIGFLLAKASARYNEILTARFADAGYPEVRASYGSVLVPLFEQDGRRLGELAAASRLSKQTMTGLVAACESDGLVERERDSSDGRAFVVRLSPRGKRFKRTAQRELGRLDRLLRDRIGPNDQDALVRALKGVMQL